MYVFRLPVLASAAGALGASYCPPFLSVDGSYNPRPTGQTSALPAPRSVSLFLMLFIYEAFLA